MGAVLWDSPCSPAAYSLPSPSPPPSPPRPCPLLRRVPIQPRSSNRSTASATRMARRRRCRCARRALSRSLAAVWKRPDDSPPKENEPVPGFDIASNSNAREVARAEVKVERQDLKRATVAARLFDKYPMVEHPASDDIVRYDFIREHGRWVIDDVRSTIDAREWSLK